MNQRFCFFLILSVSGFYSVYAEKKDSVEVPKSIHFYDRERFNSGDTSFSGIDTTLYHFQIYTNRNNLGNNGLPNVLLTPPPLAEPGFNYSPDNLRPYRFTNERIHYYNTTVPYSRIFYVLGTKKEQYLETLHTQNVNRNLNFAAAFNRIRSDGFYQRQNTNHNTFNLSSNYTSTNERYALLSNIIYNSLNYAENGGIAHDTAFENGTEFNKSLMEVNFSSPSSSAQQKFRQRSFYARQFINFGPKKDENPTDSVTIKKIVPKSSLSHSFFIEDNAHLYTDQETNESDFYSQSYYDTTGTKDSLYYRKMGNELRWNSFKQQKDSGSGSLAGEIGLKHDYTVVRQYSYSNDTTRQKLTDNNTGYLSLRGRLYNYGPEKKFLFDTDAKYVVKGYSEKSYEFGLTLKQLLKNKSNYFQLRVNAKSVAPDFFYRRYFSNHFTWRNQFDNTTMQSADLRFVSGKLSLEAGGSFHQYSNFIYLDHSALPRQFASTFNIVSGFVNKDFRIKKFTFSNRIRYQKKPDTTIVRLPELVTYQSLFFTLDLFKKALHTSFGIDVFYNSSYYANAYMPALGQFYLQNAKKTGNYPYFDFFFSMKIKTARIFLKYEHLNSGLMGNIYYAAPGYPMPDRAFKFGISWSAFN